MGVIKGIEGDYLIIDSLPSDDFEIEQFIIRRDIIESVWVYK